jgi:shikimate dehydrogenase
MADLILDLLRESRPTKPRPTQPAGSILVGLIGRGIGLSRTPALHEREGAAQGLAYVYRLIDLAPLGLDASALPGLVRGARHLGFTGLNVTHPFKQAIVPLLDLAPQARALGAVNTVVFGPDGRAIGHNTDWSGFSVSFVRELGDVPRQRVVLLGAGGAGAAVGYALLTLGVGALAIVDIEAGRAARLAAEFNTQFGADRATAEADVGQVIASADGLVNTTPVGMAQHPGLPIATQYLRATLWVADIVYFPLETELLRAARAVGCRTMSGGGMAVFQAAAAFRLFTGRDADAARMIAHFDSM